jgi:hypothetical protein
MALGVPVSASTATGKFRTAAGLPAMTSRGVDPHDVNVWLPDGHAPGDRHPVVYIVDLEQVPDSEGRMHDAAGPSGHIAALAAAALCRSAIVVGIGRSAKRLRYYTPAAPLALLPDELRTRCEVVIGGPALSDAYLQFLVEVVKPAVDMAFPTLPGRSHSFVAGAGMGGLISLYALTRYPGVFGGAASLSTERAILPPDLATELDDRNWSRELQRGIAGYLARALPRASTRRLYVDYSDPTHDGLSWPLRRAFEHIASAKGYVRYRDLESQPLTERDRTEEGRRERADVAATLLLKSCFERAETD